MRDDLPILPEDRKWGGTAPKRGSWGLELRSGSAVRSSPQSGGQPISISARLWTDLDCSECDVREHVELSASLLDMEAAGKLGRRLLFSRRIGVVAGIYHNTGGEATR